MQTAKDFLVKKASISPRVRQNIMNTGMILPIL